MSRPAAAAHRPTTPGRTRPAAGVSPLARLTARLRSLSPDDFDAYAVTDLGRDGCGGPGDRPGWVPVNQVVAAMVASGGEHLSISPAVAGARMIGSLGYAVAGRSVVAVVVSGQAWNPGPESLAMRVDQEGLIEAVGVRDPGLAVAGGDLLAQVPVAGGEAVTVLPDPGAVAVWAADRAFATLDPLVRELHELTHYGRVPMWNLVADTVTGPAVTAAERAGIVVETGWTIGSAFVDALVTAGAPIRRRGRLRLPPATDRPSVVRGSCCLYFRQDAEKCATCPLTRPAGAPNR